MRTVYHKRKALLTPREIEFYQQLKPIADIKGLIVFAQVRLADLLSKISTKIPLHKRIFAGFKARQIDFVLCDAQTFEIKCLIELDDSTHELAERHSRDSYVNTVVRKSGHNFIRCNPSNPSAHERVCNIL